ncbi:hypothetical protein QIS99_28770 [Streptomyces sp. B-S-A8]|uniref:ABC transporter permease n=1 Tax=Streptomyces solicavernae TaxID=3043614 RepID=A0ABT6S0C9_9ACTN|nr:hypothetical protein [Streptomyces sp. B-S-A8]MDI3390154.1 hypothetical protein [Streptomyces sp. B-S-A8]
MRMLMVQLTMPLWRRGYETYAKAFGLLAVGVLGGVVGLGLVPLAEDAAAGSGLWDVLALAGGLLGMGLVLLGALIVAFLAATSPYWAIRGALEVRRLNHPAC